MRQKNPLRRQQSTSTADAARRGDYRGEKGLTHPLCRVARPIFVNLLVDVHYYIGERLKIEISEGETENMSVCTKE